MDNNELHNLPNAGFMRRLLALLYDWLLIIALMMVLSVPLVAPSNEAIAVGNPWYRAGLIALTASFFAGFWCYRGQTLGMRAWRLKVVDHQGNELSPATAMLRFTAACFSTAAFGMGFIWILFDPDKLSWHDRLSRTRIVQLPKQSN